MVPDVNIFVPKKLYLIVTERAWIPAPSTLLRTSFAGMTRSGNRQSINRIGITYKLRTIFLDLGVQIDYNKVFIISISRVSSLEGEVVYHSCVYEIDSQLTRLLVGR